MANIWKISPPEVDQVVGWQPEIPFQTTPTTGNGWNETVVKITGETTNLPQLVRQFTGFLHPTSGLKVVYQLVSFPEFLTSTNPMTFFYPSSIWEG